MKNILHIIESLDTGEAEFLLVKTIPTLQSGFKHTVVYLRKPDTLLAELKGCEVIFLNYQCHFSLIKSVRKLLKIIESGKIHLIHAHLFMPTLLARLACPASVSWYFMYPVS